MQRGDPVRRKWVRRPTVTRIAGRLQSVLATDSAPASQGWLRHRGLVAGGGAGGGAPFGNRLKADGRLSEVTCSNAARRPRPAKASSACDRRRHSDTRRKWARRPTVPSRPDRPGAREPLAPCPVRSSVFGAPRPSRVRSPVRSSAVDLVFGAPRSGAPRGPAIAQPAPADQSGAAINYDAAHRGGSTRTRLGRGRAGGGWVGMGRDGLRERGSGRSARVSALVSRAAC